MRGAAPLTAAPATPPLLLAYQSRVLSTLRAGVSLLAVEKSRRIGLTFGLAAYAVMRAAAAKTGGGMDVWYLGYNLDMAREFVRDCAMWARSLNIAAEAEGEVLLDDADGAQAFRLPFDSGFKITALPSVPRALRGKQGLVILDEAAFHDRLAEMLKAALALLMWGGQVVVVSTHDGVANPFNLLLDEIRSGRKKGEVQTITFDQAIDDGLYERVAESAVIKGQPAAPKAEWIANIFDTYGEDAEEELNCVPKQGSGSWLDPEKLAGCEHADAGKPELYTGGLVYIGRDVARRRDLSVVHAFELVGDVLWLRERWLKRGASFAEQDAVVAAMFARYRATAYWIDQTGMGEKVVEDEQRRYGSSRAHGVLLTGPNRLDLAVAFRERVERGLIRIPPDPALRTDYRAIKKEGGVSGAVRLVNEGDVHADEFWATALACRAADVPYQPFTYRPVTPSRDQQSRVRFAGRRGLY